MMPEERPGTTSLQESEYHARRLRASVLHFLMGRSVSAAANLCTTVIVVRALAPPAYTVYILLSGMALILASLASCGLGETVQRFIPEMYVQGRRGEASTLLHRLIGLEAAAILACCLCFFLAAPSLASLLDQEGWTWAFRFACPMLFCMPLFFFLGVTLESIMLQRQMKWAVMLVSLLRLGGVAAAISLHGLELDVLLAIDSAAYGLGTILAGYSLLRCTEKPRPLRFEEHPGVLRRRMVSFAFFNYLMALANLFQTNAMNRVVAARFLPSFALAELCFAQAMAEMVQRYMPQMLLINILRPAIMARYAGEGNVESLNREANAVFKTNLFLLTPLLLWTALCGDSIGFWISNGKYPQVGHLLAGFIAFVAMQCHYRRLEMLAQATERSHLLLASNMVVLLALVPAALLAREYGAWGIISAVMAGVLCRDLLLGWWLHRAGLPCAPDWAGLARLAAGAFATWLLLSGFSPAAPSPLVILLGIACLLVFLACSLVTRPFSEYERGVFKRHIGHRFFR